MAPAASLGPVASLTQLNKAASEEQLCEVLPSVAVHVRSIASQGAGNALSQQEASWLAGVAHAATTKIAASPAKGRTSQQQLVAVACDACQCLLSRSGMQPTQAATLAAYSLMRQLVSVGEYGAALAHGWRLHDVLAHALAGSGAAGAPRTANSSVMEMYMGSVLNIVICTGEAPGALRHEDVEGVNVAVARLLRMLG